MIIDQILADFDYTPTIRKALFALKEELKHSEITPLVEDTSDRSPWDAEIQPWLGKTWLEIPWYLAETFLYRKILEAVEYFQPGPWMGQDPYERLKVKEIRASLPIFIETYKPFLTKQPDFDNFSNACYNALWGNRGDLSNLQVFETDMSSQHEKIILNQAEEVYNHLLGNNNRIAYIFDNVGKELYFDLALIDTLFTSGLANSVTCYLKNQPFFVSDVMPKDFLNAVDHLASSGFQKAEALASRITTRIKSNQIMLEAPPFFTSASMYREMPKILSSQIGKHDLAILKGDVNYRRLFDDRHWPPTTTITEAGGHFPTSFMSLRTLKGEIILGISTELTNNLKNQAEEDWMTNGKRGMITFFQKPGCSE